ncbi:phosphoenolpyruvate synthase [Desemzia sp. RIT804]|uniref:phosphoenolpyruvate synthase n=1 Tax=Desemzia sp. RIT 804 TaxID=2810209 RepID=UPI00194E9A7E|nr:phosphoenolpyruvate synthase [Desemzia sp. RIT 804]MBM6614943.1 phosphoenolpyruvate synthase [Desemzia sp. RIT 804]
MKKLTDLQRQSVGSKAYNLHLMKKQGLVVPAFSVFSFDLFDRSDTHTFLMEQQTAYHTGKYTLDELSQRLQQEFKAKFLQEDFTAIHEFKKLASGKHTYSVRSSANVEDDVSASFAGQFSTRLFVEADDLVDAVEETLLSLYQPAALSYYFENGFSLETVQLHVILQNMIAGTLSGVYFTANPQGLLNEQLIVVGEGVGSGIVEDKVDTTMVTIHPDDQLSYFETAGASPILTEKQQADLEEMAKNVTELFGLRMDIEFTFLNGQLYVLQARPITKMPTDPVIILDNSNIVESYPGTTTPLTFSFIQEAYGSIFRGLAKRMLKNDTQTLRSFEPTFQNMIAQVNSRVYYQITNWYKLLQLLPFSKQIIPIWQDMLGVQTTDVSATTVKISRSTRLKIIGRIIKSFIQAPRSMKKLDSDFEMISEKFDQIYTKEASFEELHQLFEQIKRQVLEQWDITLINDLYAFVYTGVLKKFCSPEEVQAEIAGIEQIESMKPVIELNKVIYTIQEDGNSDYRKKIETLSLELAADFIDTDVHPITQDIRLFIHRFGDRAPEELKLETATFRSQPSSLIQLIQQQLGLPPSAVHTNTKANSVSKSRNPLVNWLKKQAMTGIKYRESSRLNRTRIYGMMRLLFVTMGEHLVKEKRLEKSEDVFYLTMTELFELAGHQDLSNMQMEIKKRQHKRSVDQQLPAFSRLIYAGSIFEKYPQNINHQKIASTDQQDFQGIGCSKGVVRGQVLVVEDIQAVNFQQSHDKIIVTKMTDPGWVYLLTQSKGIIAEKGSLLSHTAIISRELGIPSVVNVKQATQQLKTGEWIEINGQTGLIKRLEDENDYS